MNAQFLTSTLAKHVDDRISNGPVHLREIMRAVRDASCAYTAFHQTGESCTLDTPAAGPVITLIGDDLFCALGPNGFQSGTIDTAIARSSIAAIFSGEPEAHLYDVAAYAAARDRHHVLIVETRAAQAIAWMRHIKKLRPNIRFLPSAVPAGQA